MAAEHQRRGRRFRRAGRHLVKKLQTNTFKATTQRANKVLTIPPKAPENSAFDWYKVLTTFAQRIAAQSGA